MMSIFYQIFRYPKYHYLSFRHASNVSKKISYHFSVGDVPLLSHTIGELVDVAADKNGDVISYISVHQGIAKNYTELRNEVVKFASGLISIGLKKGDRIGIWSPNCYEWPVVQYAAAKAGLILVTLNPAYQAAELEYCLKKVRCKAVVSWDQLKKQDNHKVFCNMIPDLATFSSGKIQSKDFPHLERIIVISDEAKEGTISYKDVLNAGNAESNDLLASTEKKVQFDDPVNIQFTSGTTGKPKAAVLTHHNLVNNAYLGGRRSEYHLYKSISCCQIPLFHTFACGFGSLSAPIFQNTCIFPSLLFNSKESLMTIEKYKCTTAYGAPTMFIDILQKYREFKPNVESLQRVVVGGAASPESLVRQLKEELNLYKVYVAYGCTETSPGAAGIVKSDDFELAVKGIMRPYEHIEVKVVDNDGLVVPINTPGELCIRGHNVFMGYWEEPEKTSEVLDKTRWYHTGDLFTMNENGYIKVVGRKKDMVIRGGENIYLLEVENFLHTHPAVLEVQVVGVPDERMGEELCAWICLKDGEKLTEEELRKYCQGKISHFKVPRYIMFVKEDEFPRVESGKIKKFEIERISRKKLNL